MSFIKIPKGWRIPERRATPEGIYLSRRQLVAGLGLGGIALASGGLIGCDSDDGPAMGGDGSLVGPDAGVIPASDAGGGWAAQHADLYPARRNAGYTVPERGTTPEELATRYNNFYEFTVQKDKVWQKVDAFVTYPWTVEIGGLVPRPRTYDLDALVRQLGLEERIYRFRCVEAWSMTVPWTGFPLKKLIDLVQPLSSARYLRMVTASRPLQMPGVLEADYYPWPYHEGLRMDEATNELTLMVTGLYGKVLPGQNGAPLRLIVPWKYGYKSIKSIVRIEFVEQQPATFWNTLQPAEYGFESNVDPEVPHPRWSQASERLIDTGETIPTLPFNGYGEHVAGLYG